MTIKGGRERGMEEGRKERRKKKKKIDPSPLKGEKYRIKTFND